jgi:hypothetical protein
MTDGKGDADKLRGLGQLLNEQEQRVTDPDTRKPGGVEAARAVVDALVEESQRVLRERQSRSNKLQARAALGEITHEQFLAEFGALWGAAPGASENEILHAMVDWVRRAAPDKAHSERVFAGALKRLKGDGEG